ncbi:MAG: S8 family serine peptidase [Hyphomicrobiales bacterium]
MKTRLFTFLLILISLNLFSQNYKKLDVGLKSELSNNTKRSNTSYDVFVEGNTNTIKSIITENGGVINTVTSTLLTANIPYRTLEVLSISEEVKHIQLAKRMQPNNSELIKNIDAIKVHQGENPLKQAYKGKGVIIGIVDTGIKWDHEDFRTKDDPNKSRILAIWDQMFSFGDKPEGFSYGAEYTKEKIDDALKNSSSLSTSDAMGHGTHVAGIAAGKLGVAPEADIIVVKIDLSKSTSSVDAAKYIYGIADQLNRPCVINTSYGFHNTLHNGSDPTEVMIEEMLKEKPGRAYITSAGNTGGSYTHLEIDAKPNTEQWSWFVPEKTVSFESKLYGVVKNEDLDKLSVSIGVDSTIFKEEDVVVPSKLIGTTDYITLKEVADSDEEKKLSLSYGDNSTAAKIEMTVAKKNEEYSEITINVKEKYKYKQTNQGLAWVRLYIKGSGKIHIWNLTGKTMHNPEEHELETDDQYIFPDNSSSIGAPGTSKDIITVGAYINRTSWKNSLGKVIDLSTDYKTGDFAHFSSQGPTIDGRTKPDISAPGMFVMSTLADNQNSAAIISLDKKHVIKSGTSMSCPAVTGAIALLLEKDPKLTNKEIRNILFNTTDKDEYTGELTTPDNKWGFGKMNIYKALVNITDTEGISDLNNKALKSIYPNPCNEYIQLKLNSTNSCIYSLHGLG